MKALLDCFWLPNYWSYWQCNAYASGNEYLQKKNKSVRWWIFSVLGVFLKVPHHEENTCPCQSLSCWLHLTWHHASFTSSLSKTNLFLVTLCSKCLCFKSSQSILAALPHFFLLKNMTWKRKGTLWPQQLYSLVVRNQNTLLQKARVFMLLWYLLN